MAFESILRTDILPEDLKTSREKVNFVVETQYNQIVTAATRDERTTTKGNAKTIVETMELVGDVVTAYEERTNPNADARVRYLYEEPDSEAQLETISVELIDRQPGVFGRFTLKDRHFQGKVRNLAPILREEKEDTENPGYRMAVLGYFYDNTLRFTCWARTNKTALNRALWFEEVMEQYKYYFVISGVNRILPDGRGPSRKEKINGNRLFGISLDYFVRTEKLRAVSQKELEQVYVKLAVQESSSLAES